MSLSHASTGAEAKGHHRGGGRHGKKSEVHNVEDLERHCVWENVEKCSDYLKFRVGCLGYDKEVANVAVRCVFKYMATHFKNELDSSGLPSAAYAAPKPAEAEAEATGTSDSAKAKAVQPAEAAAATTAAATTPDRSSINFCPIHADLVTSADAAGKRDQHLHLDCFCMFKNVGKDEDAMTVAMDAVSHILGISKVLLKKWVLHYLSEGPVSAENVVRGSHRVSHAEQLLGSVGSEHDAHILEVEQSLWMKAVSDADPTGTGTTSANTDADQQQYYVIQSRSDRHKEPFDVSYDLHDAKEHGFSSPQRVAEFVWQTHPTDWRQLYRLRDDLPAVAPDIAPASSAPQSSALPTALPELPVSQTKTKSKSHKRSADLANEAETEASVAPQSQPISAAPSEVAGAEPATSGKRGRKAKHATDATGTA